MSEPRDPFPPGYSPYSSAPGDTTVFEVPGGLYIKAKSMVRVPGGLLLDGAFYPFSLWGMVDNAEVERIKAETAALEAGLDDD